MCAARSYARISTTPSTAGRLSRYGPTSPTASSTDTTSQYEICANPVIVDLLVSLTYIAAAEGALDAPLPVGMGLRVPCRSAPVTLQGQDKLFDFDQLDLPHVCQTRSDSDQ